MPQMHNDPCIPKAFTLLHKRTELIKASLLTPNIFFTGEGISNAVADIYTTQYHVWKINIEKKKNK